jgi:pimeloyl-ACP methyl ester carboxylesterase
MSLEILESHPAQEGTRPPILLAHGAWHGAWCWNDHLLPFLAENGHDAYAVEPPRP